MGGFPGSRSKAAPVVTTSVAIGWGIVAAFTMFRALFFEHSVALALAYIITLLVVWATLERKRWGRLALLGMSIAVPLTLISGLVYFAYIIGHSVDPFIATSSSAKWITSFCCGPTPAAGLILLSLLAGLWLQQPTVAAEFERGKHRGLATSQRGIAVVLVGLWLVIVFSSSMVAKQIPQPRRLAATTIRNSRELAVSIKR